MKTNWLIGKLDKDTRSAIWQYIIDHSIIQNNGYYGIQFYCKDEPDFWRRIQARIDGKYKVYEKEDKEILAIKKSDIYNQWKWFKRNAEYNQEICNSIKKQGSIKKRIALFLYRKTRDYLFNKKPAL